MHFPRPMTRYFQETHPPAFKKGTNDFARFYGLLIDGLQIGYVNGFGYNQVLPAPDAEIPERFQRAEQVFAQKLWREQLRDWDENCKPAAIATHRELQAVDPDALSDAELVAYLTRCRDHHSAMIAQHMRFTAGAVLPTGDFLAHVGDWTGLPPSELLGLMRGSAEVSAGGSDEMERLKGAFAQDPAAREVLASDGDPAQVLASLRSLGGEAGAAVSGYLDLVGNRLIDGFDIAEPTALELPDALLRAIRIAVSGEAQAASDVDARIAEVRAKVPAAHQDEFDELLGEARLTYRLRDERGVYSDIWASGLMRRAALAAGRRVARRGRIATPQQMLDASLDEMCALVAGTGGPSADELASRAEYRATYTAKDAPPLAWPARAASARPRGPAPIGRPRHARDLHRPGPPLRQLPGAERGKGPLRARGEQGRLRRARAPRLRALRVRPDRQGRRARHRVDDRGLQHPPPAARRDRHRQWRPAFACGDRLARIRHPRRRRDPRGDRAHRRRRPCSRRRGCRRGHGARVKKVVPFTKARETSLYGSKAVGLGDAARQGLPVPPGVALSGDLVEAVASGDEKAIEKVAKAIAALPPPFAVRSSAVDEDGAAASFAGQHLTVLNVHSAADVPGAVREVWWSANSDSAITYRQRVGLFTRPSVGVVVQTLLNPDVAGVMFTEHPVTGADERLIEASWGLGEAVVAGLVVPDHFRLDRSGQVLERKAGRKRIAIRSLPNGGTFEQQVPPAQVNQLCLDDAQLAALGELALQCEKVYGPRRDIEWAFQDGTLYLLQCRAVTTGKARSEAPPPGPPPRDPVAALQRVELFADMDRRQAEQIARLLKERRFAKGETVIMEGSGGAAFFLIDSGEATVSSKGVDLATLGPGDYFGEIALIDGGPRSATVTAATDLVCYGLTFWEFRPLVERNGTIGWKLLQALAKRLRANVGA